MIVITADINNMLFTTYDILAQCRTLDVIMQIVTNCAREQPANFIVSQLRTRKHVENGL